LNGSPQQIVGPLRHPTIICWLLARVGIDEIDFALNQSVQFAESVRSFV
jgi:hypothetical protein